MPESNCRSLHRAGVTAETLRPWSRLGITTAAGWQLVASARLSLEQARRWTAAELSTRRAILREYRG